MSYLGAYSDSIWDEKSWGADAYSFANSLYKLQPYNISYGTLEASWDEDWYRLDVKANHQYVVDLTSDSYWYGWNSYRNGQFLEFDLVDGLGSIQLSSVPTLLYDDQLLFNSFVDDTYYIKVHGLEFSATDYALTVQETYVGPPNNQAVFYTTGFAQFGDNDGVLEVGEQLYFDVTDVVDLDGIGSSIIEQWIGRDPSTGNLSTLSDSNFLTLTQEMLGMQVGYTAYFIDGLGNTETFVEYFSQNVSENHFDNLDISDPLQFREFFGNDQNNLTGLQIFLFWSDGYYNLLGLGVTITCLLEVKVTIFIRGISPA